MTIAALYDIHGNLPALEAVLEEVRGESVDEILVGGDVFPGPMAGEVLDLLLSLDMPVRFIRGNGDRAVLSFAAGEGSDDIPEKFQQTMRWLAERLDPKHRDAMESWPESTRAELPGTGPVFFCHATPRSDTEIFTRLTPEDRLLKLFRGLDASIVVCGHTHMKFDRTVGDIRVVNAGSIGMPFGATGAHWLLLNPEVQLRVTDYDRESAARRIRLTDYPDAEAFVENNVLQSPSEEEALEMLGRVAL